MLMEKQVKKYNVFIDLDGVVANLVKSVCDVTGFNFSDWPRGKYEIDFIPGFNFADMTHDWWANIPKMHDADEIVSICEKRFKFENCYILTAPCDDSYVCDGGKRAWIAKHFPRYKRKTLVARCKEACAGPNSILIDDSPKNCIDFQLNNGTAFMVPRYWNNILTPEPNPIEKLEEFVDCI